MRMTGDNFPPEYFFFRQVTAYPPLWFHPHWQCEIPTILGARCSGHVNWQAPMKSKDPSWFIPRNVLLLLSSLFQTRRSDAIFTMGKLVNSSSHPNMCVKATSQRAFMQVLLPFHNPAQVSPNRPRHNGSSGHSFPFRNCFTRSNEIYRRFIIAEGKEQRVLGHPYLLEQAQETHAWTQP